MMKPMKRMKTSRRHLCAGGCHTMTHDLYTRRDNKFRDPLYLCEECAKTIGAMAGLVEPKEPEVQPVPEVPAELKEPENKEVPEVEEPAETPADPEPEVTDEPAEEPNEPAEPEKPKKTGGRGGKPKQKAAE